MKNTLICLFILTVLTACQKELEFSDVYPQDEVVVNALFAEDSIWFVNLGWSRSILETNYNGFETIDDGEVKIMDAFGSHTYLIGLGNGWYGSKEMTPKSGYEYSIEVHVPEREIVLAKDLLPEHTPILRLDHNSKNNFTEEEILFTIEFQDEVGTDYYYLEILNEELNSSQISFYDILAINGNFQPIYPELFGQDYFYGRAYVTDEGLDGEKIRLDFFINQYYNSGQIVIRLVHASRNAYLYNYSKEVQEISEFNPFAQPAIIHSNVENGYGIFGGASISEMKFKIGG